MDVFGHVGLTLAAAYSAEHVFRQRVPARWLASAQRSPVWVEAPSRRPGRAPQSELGSLDYRIVIFGALLPDIIDKPLGFWLASDLVNHSLRTYGHTVIFAAVLLIVSGIALRAGWNRGLLPLAASSAGHLVLDQMWRNSATVLWPGLGWSFPAGVATFGEWSGSHLRETRWFYSDPAEIVGAIVILVFLIMLLRRSSFLRFLRTGAAA